MNQGILHGFVLQCPLLLVAVFSVKRSIGHSHNTILVQDIKEELGKVQHNIQNITNIRHWHTKESLPLLFVDVEPNENKYLI